MPLLILLLNYLSVERVAPYVAALQEILERDPTLLHVIRQAVVAQMRAHPADSDVQAEASMDDVKRDASMDEMTQAASIGAEEALMGGDPPAGARDRVQRDFQRGPRGIQDRC